MVWDNTKHTNHPEWQKTRRWAKKHLPQHCATPGCPETTNLELDHIIEHKAGGTHTPDNAQWLCKPHHREKTEKFAAQRRVAWKKPQEPHPGVIRRHPR